MSKVEHMPPEAEPPIQATPTADDQELLPTKSPQAIELQLQHVKPNHEMQYRPDIDGLRTLTVVPVVLFHAYPQLFPGGFIGVDIFVISGYLISGNLLKEHSTDQFSYYNFYSRRVRRIFPILLVVLATTLWMGCLYFLASKLKALAATMLAGSLFCANVQVLS
ncbi:hypothetical protein LEN26_021126 [Aphanomyces euteiches]|nr:hypothetical protein LEN26_021126 [Aphanomyces euteiches]KAH9125454.1 hypothetical protein AeMF1_003931 [Aphanomyces euteiches]